MHLAMISSNYLFGDLESGLIAATPRTEGAKIAVFTGGGTLAIGYE